MSKIIINGVLGLAINDQKQVFLTQRSEPGDPNFDKKWNIPGGGMEWGEKPEDTLTREFSEELNIVPTIISPHPITITSIQGDVHVLLLCYVISIGDQVIDTSHDPDQETMAFGWFTQAEANKLDTLPETRETIAKAFAIMS